MSINYYDAPPLPSVRGPERQLVENLDRATKIGVSSIEPNVTHNYVNYNANNINHYANSHELLLKIKF
jgi:hypothetical protein